MSEVNFKSLQAQHESLLQRQQGVTNENQQDFTKMVREFIEQAKQGGSHIASTRERDQVRANLRYWANYIYGIEGVFPDTELAPSTVTGGSSFWTSGLGLATLGLGLVLLIGLGSVLFRDNGMIATKPPAVTEPPTEPPVATEPVVGTSTFEATTPDVNPTTAFDALVLVALTGPENGANVLPRVQFTGVSANLDVEDSIHLLIVREELFFPIKEFVTQEHVSATGEWTIKASLYRDDKELEQAENLIVVPAVCFDQQCRDTLANAVQTGITISPLPPQLSFNSFNIYRDSSRVFYRNAYQAVQETRVVYSVFYEGSSSFDLYTSRTDGGDRRQITYTSDISELSPSLSPDGTKIAYVKRLNDTSGNGHVFAIAVMDSNGGNDVEITARIKNALESPQWSYDGGYISYAMGDTSQSSIRASWNIHVYEVATRLDEVISEEPESFVQPYHTWLPDEHSIVFEARPQESGTSGFDLQSMDLSEASSHFFDTDEDDIQPSLKSLGDGYLITYTEVDDDKNHNIYAAVVNSGQDPIRLTNRRAGEIVDGERIAQANFPIPDPNANWIYYVRRENIYKVEFNIEDSTIVLTVGENRSDGEQFGDLVVETGLNDEILGFDIGYMEAFFPIIFIPTTGHSSATAH